MTGNCTVTASFFPFSKGEMLSVFFILCFLCRVWCLLSFLLPFFSSKGRFLKKFSGANFCFWGSCWSCVFWWRFAYVFASLFGGSLPKVSEKILLMSGLVFFGVLSLFPLCFPSTSFFVFFLFFEEI